MKFIKILSIIAIFAAFSFAQIPLATTTLTQSTQAMSWWPLSVASSANIPNYWSGSSILVIDGEAMCSRLVVGSYVQVSRGCNGTNTQNHSAGATVYIGPPQAFYFLAPGTPGGPCTPNPNFYTPYIVLNAGGSAVKWTCTGGFWVTS